MKKSHKSLLPGSKLEDGKAHQQAHNGWTRRDFLTQMGFAGGVGMLLSNLPLRALSASPLMQALSQTETDRILVLIQLKGGNDGINTIIPLYEYDFYANQRPSIRIPENQIINLSDEHGMPNSMSPMNALWQNGKMKVVHAVGYPNQNLSHFRSTDIWTSASDADVNITSGWLGRWLDGNYPDYANDPPNIPPAIQIGGPGSLLFSNGEFNLSVSVANPEQLFEIARTGQLYNPTDVPPNCYGEELQFMRTIANSTFRYAEAIKNAYDAGNNQVEYGNSGIDEQLALVARLIRGNMGSCLYLVSLDGFDTHANQNNLHPYLMNSLSNAIAAFYQDLSADGWDQKVLAMTFSEFGRRIEQNASNGTDHGSAAPLMLFGPALNGSGFVGAAPELQNPDEFGNLRFHTDFREVYATVLENWLCVDGNTVDSVLGRHFDRLTELGLSCQATSRPNAHRPQLVHQALYKRGAGEIVIQYQLPRASAVRIEVLNLTGQKVVELKNQPEAAGTHQATLAYRNMGLAAGSYVYRIQALGGQFSKVVSVMR